jgi:hypothetical protein
MSGLRIAECGWVVEKDSAFVVMWAASWSFDYAALRSG